ncbi:hypothetical protein Goshw_023909, partial [Gossypium schwendimanii]|nr:hypothetical protein [Gossypium schwendimanii]
VKVEKQLGLPIKTLRFDRREEYLLDEFIGYHIENKILSQLIMRGNPQQNSVAATPAPKCDNPLEYSSCLNAYKKPPPSAGCCQKMKEQAPCYCEYMKIEDVKRVFD